MMCLLLGRIMPLFTLPALFYCMKECLMDTSKIVI